MMIGVTKRPLSAPGLLYLLELTPRVLEDREGDGLLVQFSGHLEPEMWLSQTPESLGNWSLVTP